MLWLRLRFHCDVRSVSAPLCLFFCLCFAGSSFALAFCHCQCHWHCLCLRLLWLWVCFRCTLHAERSGARCLRFKSIRKQIKTFQDLYAQLSKSARVRLSAQGSSRSPSFLSLLLHDLLKQRYLWLCNASPRFPLDYVPAFAIAKHFRHSIWELCARWHKKGTEITTYTALGLSAYVYIYFYISICVHCTCICICICICTH